MKEIIRISLDNEMDLILAHKRAMKLAELCGLISSAQTRFATAVSEIARCSIASGENSSLILGIGFLSGGKKDITAIIYDDVDLEECNPEAYTYASKLSRDIKTQVNNGVYETSLNLKIPFSGVISENRIASFKEYFKKETSLSPYGELRKKNMQLIELSEKLSESESKYRQLTDTLPLLVFSITGAGTVTLSNKRVKDIFGSQFAIFSTAAMSSFIHSNDLDLLIKGWDSAKKKAGVYAVQVRIKINNSFLWHIVSFVPDKDDRGEISGWIISMFDIHAQKLIEETLKDNKELRAAQESLKDINTELSRKNGELEQFAYVASHDLQEPLRKIRNFISLAERGIKDEEKSALYLDKINDSAERMSLLVRDILNYSTLNSLNDEFEEINLNGIVADVVKDFDLHFKEGNAQIFVDKLPVVRGISVQMSQLFYNFIGNAIKFTDINPIININYFRAEILEHGETIAPGIYHCISVKDNGIGIEEQYMSKIFSIFQRLHPQSSYKGTGIGLSLCKKIAENHKGTITVESTPGVGSDFSIYLPV